MWNRTYFAALPASRFAIEGVDSSSEMLAACREKAARMGLSPTLYQQYMQELDLPQRYTSILIPLGTFILIGHHDEAMEALRRFQAHLVPGGQLVFSTPAPWNEMYAAPQKADEWGEPHSVACPADGATIALYSKGNVDRLEQVYRGQQRYELHKDGQPQRHEVHDVAMRWYGKPEMTLMLCSPISARRNNAVICSWEYCPCFMRTPHLFRGV